VNTIFGNNQPPSGTAANPTASPFSAAPSGSTTPGPQFVSLANPVTVNPADAATTQATLVNSTVNVSATASSQRTGDPTPNLGAEGVPFVPLPDQEELETLLTSPREMESPPPPTIDPFLGWLNDLEGLAVLPSGAEALAQPDNLAASMGSFWLLASLVAGSALDGLRRRVALPPVRNIARTKPQVPSC